MASDVPVPMSTLLTHRDWVRRLARSLVRDEASADDLEQRTWLAALRRPPRDATTVRAWLARVVSRQAMNAHRGATRRDVHEFAAARPEALRSTADVVAEAESHKLVVLAVLDLDEPYRSTVLLRWFENLPPRDVAGRMGVPVETVRTRLRRAHDVIRGRIGKDESDCVRTLAPLLVAWRELARTGAVNAEAAGAGLLGAKASFVAAACCLAVAGGTLVRGSDDGASTNASRPATTASLGAKSTSSRPAHSSDAATAPLITMTDVELLERIRTLLRSDLRGVAVDGKGVIATADVLLARPIDAATRSEALSGKGVGFRALADFAAAETCFRQAAASIDAKTPQGRWARLQLGWAAAQKGDSRSAAETFMDLAQDGDAPVGWRALYRAYAAMQFRAAGDAERAAAEFRTVVNRFADSRDRDARTAIAMARKALLDSAVDLGRR